MTEDQIKHMVNRFLGYKLPATFSPDGGVTFKRIFPPELGPSGTNLLCATEADAMVRYMIDGMPQFSPYTLALALKKFAPDLANEIVARHRSATSALDDFVSALNG